MLSFNNALRSCFHARRLFEEVGGLILLITVKSVLGCHLVLKCKFSSSRKFNHSFTINFTCIKRVLLFKRCSPVFLCSFVVYPVIREAWVKTFDLSTCCK